MRKCAPRKSENKLRPNYILCVCSASGINDDVYNIIVEQRCDEYRATRFESFAPVTRQRKQ